MNIIPAIDIIEGKCVRLEQGQYQLKKVYNENPVELARQFEAHGIKHLHLVDLDGAKSKQIVNWKVLEAISNATQLKIDFGGGIKSEKDLKIAFECGAKQITAGSIAVTNKALVLNWIHTFGADKIILGADVMNEQIAINGWKERTEIGIFDFIEDYQTQGIRRIICTDISKDGMLNGCSIDLYQNILKQFPNIQLVASGGISSLRELDLLKSIKIDGAIIGKAIYENKITLKALQNYVD